MKIFMKDVKSLRIIFYLTCKPARKVPHAKAVKNCLQACGKTSFVQAVSSFMLFEALTIITRT